MSEKTSLNEEEIIETLDEISDDDVVEIEESDGYDSDADPEYFPQEIENVYDELLNGIGDLNIEDSAIQNKEKRMEIDITPEPSTTKSLTNKKRKEMDITEPSTSKLSNSKKRKKSSHPATSKTSSDRGVLSRNRGPLQMNNNVDETAYLEVQHSLIVQPTVETLDGKDNFVWQTKCENTSGKIPSKNIIHIKPGPTANARQAEDPIECLRIFFTPEIIDIIVTHTNEEILRKRENYKDQNHFSLKEVNAEEIDAYIGLLILSAALKDNHLAVKLLFNSNYCGNRYRATMTERRFQFITDCLRFDDKQSREQRKQENKLAAISEIWELFIKNCVMSYKPSSYVTIDEQLIGFRGKCPFRMYIPSKPNKYGLKLVMMCDNNSKYMINAIPYLGKGTVPNKTPAADYFVEKLVAPTISGSNRNLTMDNWFTSIPLAEKLLHESKLTMVGTIKKNKRELPKEFTDLKYSNREVGTSMFLFHGDITAVSYKAKMNKIVTLISTMHQGGSVNEESKKPEIVLSYNATKGSVDTFDQMCQNMNCGRKTNRWPMCFFYNMINIAVINAYVIFIHNSYRSGKDKSAVLTRMDFMLTLHGQLTENLQKSRLMIKSLSKDVKTCIGRAIGREERLLVAANQQGERRYCSFCDYKKKRMTTTYCPCGKAICGEHMRKKCPECN